MAGVEAHPEPLGVARPVEQPAQFRERPAERVAGTGRVLEGDPHARAARAARELVECGRHPREPGTAPRALVGAGVDDDQGQAERLGALELVLEGPDRPPPLGPARRTEVDQVARVGERVPDSGRPSRRLPESDVLVREGAGPPPQLVLHKDLDRRAAERVPAAIVRSWLAIEFAHPLAVLLIQFLT